MIVARKDMRDQISDLIAKMMGYTLKGSNFVKADSQITEAPAALSVESVESKKSDKKSTAVAKVMQTMHKSLMTSQASHVVVKARKTKIICS